MAHGDCWLVNPEFNPACRKSFRIADFGGRPHLVCDACLMVCSIADTYAEAPAAGAGRGKETVHGCPGPGGG